MKMIINGIQIDANVEEAKQLLGLTNKQQPKEKRVYRSRNAKIKWTIKELNTVRENMTTPARKIAKLLDNPRTLKAIDQIKTRIRKDWAKLYTQVSKNID